MIGAMPLLVWDNRGADILHHELAPALAHGHECAVQSGALLILAAEHGDALAIFAQARERIAVIGLGLILILGDDDKAAGNAHHRAAGQHGVEESGDH